MGQAKRRGTRDERIAQAHARIDKQLAAQRAQRATEPPPLAAAPPRPMRRPPRVPMALATVLIGAALAQSGPSLYDRDFGGKGL